MLALFWACINGIEPLMQSRDVGAVMGVKYMAIKRVNQGAK